MNMHAHIPGDSTAALDDEGGLIDFTLLGHYATFGAGAVRRHLKGAVLVFAITFALCGTALAVWPRSYHAEATLLARRNDLMTSLSNPTRPARPEADDPTRAASEMVHDRDNLLMLMRQTELLQGWERSRGTLSRLKERVTNLVHKPAEADRIDALLWMLDQRLWVLVDKEGVVKIGIEWPEPRLAATLVHTAVQNFIEKRHETETAAIGEAIAILQGSAASLQADVDRTIAQLRQEQARRPMANRAAGSGPEAGKKAAGAGRPVAPADESKFAESEVVSQLGRLRAALDTNREEIAKLDSARQQQLSDVRSRLAAARTVYTEDHPTVVALRQTMATASREPAELAPLRAEAQLLQVQYDALAPTAAAGLGQKDATALAAVVRLPGPTIGGVGHSADGETPTFAILPADVPQLTDLVHPASRLLTLQLGQLANLLDRINGARLELATSGAGLKFRYIVTRPPEVPNAPSTPKTIPVLVAAFLGALLLGLASAIARDLLEGRVFDAWQFERRVGIPVFGILEPLGYE